MFANNAVRLFGAGDRVWDFGEGEGAIATVAQARAAGWIISSPSLYWSACNATGGGHGVWYHGARTRGSTIDTRTRYTCGSNGSRVRFFGNGVSSASLCLPLPAGYNHVEVTVGSAKHYSTPGSVAVGDKELLGADEALGPRRSLGSAYAPGDVLNVTEHDGIMDVHGARLKHTDAKKRRWGGGRGGDLQDKTCKHYRSFSL